MKTVTLSRLTLMFMTSPGWLNRNCIFSVTSSYIMSLISKKAAFELFFTAALLEVRLSRLFRARKSILDCPCFGQCRTFKITFSPFFLSSSSTFFFLKLSAFYFARHHLCRSLLICFCLFRATSAFLWFFFTIPKAPLL